MATTPVRTISLMPKPPQQRDSESILLLGAAVTSTISESGATSTTRPV